MKGSEFVRANPALRYSFALEICSYELIILAAKAAATIRFIELRLGVFNSVQKFPNNNSFLLS
jgi:hypothetical protein